MKINSLKIYLSVLVLLFSTNLNAQRFDTVLKKLNTEYRQEKLYLQFDRSVYNPGETIWFKAYVFAGNFPSLISKTLYVELRDVKGKVMQRITAPILISGAAGSFDIPEDFSGTVIVRAYTKWMLNFDSSFLYAKAILVTTPKKSFDKLPAFSPAKTNTSTKAYSSTSLQFFPEGGDLVQGIESRVAFKATDENGMPIKVSGKVLDSKGKKITSFSSMHDGMGVFELRADSNQQYKAVWKDQQEQTHETVLPSAKQNGIVLKVNNFKNQIEFTIKHRPDSSPYPFVFVVAQMNGQLVYKAKANISKTEILTGTIPTENFLTGIVQITVFTPDEQPIAERIVFANSNEYSFTANLNLLVKDLRKRGKNTIQIEVPDTLSSNLSVSVIDADLNPRDEEDNIYSHLLLTSDIKGYVYNPAYYFSSNADSVADNLDLVMMTNGWRRFKWEDVLAGHFPALNYLPDNYLSFKGQVKNLNKKLLLGKEINGILELKDNTREYLNIPVDANGGFSFSGMIFYDTAKLFYQFNKDKNRKITSHAIFDIKSKLLNDPLHLPPDNSLLVSLNQPNTATITNNKERYQLHLDELKNPKIKTLKRVVVTKKSKTKQELMDEEYTSGFFRDDSRTILPDDDPAFHNSKNLLDYLQSRIAGLQVNPNATVNAIIWRGSVTSLFVDEISQRSIAPNGKLVEDASYILSLPMSEIAMVKIFDPPFFGAWGAGPGGAVAVYTKKPTMLEVKSLDYSLLAGYTPVKEFYSPDYSMPSKDDATDYRTTLYWKPFVLTDKNNHTITLSFYNNDITKKMKVIIEGCNEEGKLIRIEKIF